MGTPTIDEYLELVKEQHRLAAKAFDAPNKLKESAIAERAKEAIAALDVEKMKSVLKEANDGIALWQPVAGYVKECLSFVEQAAKLAEYKERAKEFNRYMNPVELIIKLEMDAQLGVLTTAKKNIQAALAKAEKMYETREAGKKAIKTLEEDFKASGERVIALHGKLEPLYEQVKSAAKSGDAAALGKAKTAFMAVWDPLDKAWDSIDATRRQFQKDYVETDALHKGTRDTFAAQLDAASKQLAAASRCAEAAAKWAREVRDVQVQAKKGDDKKGDDKKVDGKKAAKALGLDPKDAAELDGADADEGVLRKKVEALLKRIKDRRNAKEAMETLRKAKVI